MANLILANDEPLIGMAEAGRPTNTHPSTLNRWGSRGIKRKDGVVVKLETVRVGAKLKTSAAAVKRFLLALSNGPDAAPPPPTPAARLRAAEAALREMASMGA